MELITVFTNRLRALGPFGSDKYQDPENLKVRLEAARMALEGKRVRMVFGRQAKYMKHEGAYRKIPPDHKLHKELDETLVEEKSANGVLLYLHKGCRSVQELSMLLDLSPEAVLQSFKKLEKKGLVEADQLIA